jgi:hypothetical protein
VEFDRIWALLMRRSSANVPIRILSLGSRFERRIFGKFGALVWLRITFCCSGMENVKGNAHCEIVVAGSSTFVSKLATSRALVFATGRGLSHTLALSRAACRSLRTLLAASIGLASIGGDTGVYQKRRSGVAKGRTFPARPVRWPMSIVITDPMTGTPLDFSDVVVPTGMLNRIRGRW